MAYQDPLAYLLGLQGMALMRAFNGEYDRDFTEARLAEIRDLLDRADQLGGGAASDPVSTAEGYDAWAPRYDEPNDLIDLEQPVIRAILDGWRPALDAACGTGRYAAYLASRGHQVIGVESPPACWPSPGLTSPALISVRPISPGCPCRTGTLTWWSAASHCPTWLT